MVNEVTLYGIPNCDTIKKARAWLDRHDIAFRFHDYRKQGIDREQLLSMVSALGWEADGDQLHVGFSDAQYREIFG